MQQQTSLLAGVSAYQQHDYLSALKHFAQVKEAWQSDKQQAVVETLIGVSNLQLCNYNEAAKTLHRVRDRLAQFQNKDLLNSELLVVKCKVLSNLLILELLNCSQASNEYLQQLLQLISSALARSRNTAIALFKVIIKSLFGFQTFTEINTQLTHLLDKNYQTTALSINSPVYLTAISIYAHLAGQHRQAYQIQLSSYELSKEKHPLLAALSLRHLEQLCVQLKDELSRKKYQRQLKKIMSGELEGVAEQTLFRNYDKKLQLASKIVTELVRQENELMRQDSQEGVQRLAVLWKLQTMQRGQRNTRIAQVLQLIKQSRDMISVMGSNEFVKDATREYKTAVKTLAASIQKVGKRAVFDSLWKVSTKRSERDESYELLRQDRKRNDLGFEDHLEELSASRANRSFDSNSSSNKKHKEYATSLYLPKQSKQVSINDNRSKLMVNRHKKNEAQTTSHRDKDNAIYKIAKPGQQTKEQRSKVYQLLEQSENNHRDIYKPQNNSVLREERKQINISKAREKELDRRQPYRPQQQASVPLLQEISSSRTKDVPVVDPKPKQFTKTASNLAQQNKFTKTASNLVQQNKSSELKLIEQPKQSKPFALYNTNSISQKLAPINEREYNKQSLRGRRAQPPAANSIIARQALQKKLPRIIIHCQSGQYIEKRHFTSDGGAQRFLQLSKYRDKIAWADSEEAIDFTSHSASYSMNDIRGIVYGKVTETMRKECNAKLDAGKCFSLILKKRTLDFYCPKEVDILFWLPGISSCLKDFVFQNEKYASMKKSRSKLEKRMCNKAYLDDRQVTRYYSVGRVLWRRFLMRLKNEFLPEKKKEKYHRYRNPNAFAIVAAAVAAKKLEFKTRLPQLS